MLSIKKPRAFYEGAYPDFREIGSTAPPEMGEMAFCAALLFAFPAIRNVQPFAPPMGVLSDYLGFFWAESLVAVTLLIKLNMWLRRKKRE